MILTILSVAINWETIGTIYGVLLLCSIPFIAMGFDSGGPSNLKECLGCIAMPVVIPAMFGAFMAWAIISPYLKCLGLGFIVRWVEKHVFNKI